MIGHPAPSSGISYSERHSIEPDGSISERFGKPLEIPEDLLPIPDERPGVLQATHPLARFVHVQCFTGEAKEFVTPSGVIVVDGVTGTIVRLTGLTAKSADEHGALPIETKHFKAIDITYDEDAIEEENRRRFTRANEIANYFAEVVKVHQERYEARAAAAEAAKKDEAEADNKFASNIMNGLDAMHRERGDDQSAEPGSPDYGPEE